MPQTKDVENDVLAKVNGHTPTVHADDPSMPLLCPLRNDLGLHGPRFGCGLAQCGACAVHANGNVARYCITPLSAVAGKEIITLQGLSTPEKLHPIQEAFVAEQPAQCGYCINDMVMQAASLLEKTPHSKRQRNQSDSGRISAAVVHI